MLSFTLDTNCIIDVAHNRSEGSFVRRLADAHRAGLVDVAIVAVSASERQPGDTYLNTYDEFQAWVRNLSLDHLTTIFGISYWNLGFWGAGLLADAVMKNREAEVHAALFPTIDFHWPDFARKAGLDPSKISGQGAKRWRNAFCDRQMFWAHDFKQRDVFVTRDANFQRLVGSSAFPRAKIMTPQEANQLL